MSDNNNNKYNELYIVYIHAHVYIKVGFILSKFDMRMTSYCRHLELKVRTKRHAFLSFQSILFCMNLEFLRCVLHIHNKFNH